MDIKVKNTLWAAEARRVVRVGAVPRAEDVQLARNPKLWGIGILDENAGAVYDSGAVGQLKPVFESFRHCWLCLLSMRGY